MEILFLPLMILNMVGGVAAAVWLIVLGEWTVLVSGAVIAFAGNWIINIALMPGMLLFGTTGMALEKRGKNAAVLIFGTLSALYIASIVAAWCIGTLVLFQAISRDSSTIPITLFAYGCATAPWAYRAQRSLQQTGANEFSGILALSAELAFVAMGIVNVLTRPRIGVLILAFCPIMALGVIAVMLVGISEFRKEHPPTGF